jgi:hypothetical protein
MRLAMRRSMMLLAIGLGLVVEANGASTAPPSYHGVKGSIDSIRRSWATPGARPQPNAAGWNTLFDALLNDLDGYGKAGSEQERLAALERVQLVSTELAAVPWTPAITLREEIRQWLRPRLHLAEAKRQLRDTVTSLPPSADPGAVANRSRWVEFVDHDLGSAINGYESASTVAQRLAALRQIRSSLDVLKGLNQNRPWWPASQLESAINDLFNQPNVDVSADVSIVSPFFNADLVQTGPVYRKGYWSQVTAGPKTGFGLLSSDDGIAFYNKQSLVSVTPITDFQSQIARDPQGQRAAKLYNFQATSYDWSELTITTVLRTWGLSITPNSTHNIDVSICSTPADGGGLGRMIAGVIGMDQNSINQRVKDGALPRFKQQIPTEAQEEALERIGRETLTRNADLQAKGLIGNNTLAIQDILITQLSLRSRPDAVFAGGMLQMNGVPQAGADAPQPTSLAGNYEPGVTADVHLSSILTTAAAGAYQREQVRSVENLMVSIREVPQGTAPGDAVKVTKNVDFPTFLKALDEGRKATPKVTVIRVKRPENPPEFSADAKGNLVAVIRDFQLDAPAPESEAKGGIVGAAAKIYRIKIPQLELSVAYKVDAVPGAPLQLHANVADFSPGTNGEVLAITDDESKAVPLSRFAAAIVMTGLGGKLRSQPINASLDQVKLPGFTVRGISPLDPSGWIRLALDRAVEAPYSTFTPMPVASAPPAPVIQPVTTVYPQAVSPGAVVSGPVVSLPTAVGGQP